MIASGSLFEHGKRPMAWALIVAVGLLSLLPGAEVNPIRTNMGGQADHLLAYAVTTVTTMLAYTDRSRFRITVSLILYAAVLEFLQRYSPGRNSSLEDLTFSATGVMLGLAAFHVIQHLRERHANGGGWR
jgi:VanZ family protein